MPLSPVLLLAAVGSVCALPAPSSARPAAVPDCLRPTMAIKSAGSPSVLTPSSAQQGQLIAQALPPSGAATAPSSGAPLNSPQRPRAGSTQLLAKAPTPAPAVNVTQLLPACTYDPPLSPAPQVIRGLW